MIYTLLAFTLAMATLPIGTYFALAHTVLEGRQTLAGGAAAVVANCVLIGYVVVAMREDQADRERAEKKGQ